MKLLLEISDSQSKRIQSATGEPGRTALANFIAEAIESHLQRKEQSSNGQFDTDLTILFEQILELRKGQRAIAAIVDGSTAILAKIYSSKRCEANATDT